MFKRIEIWLLLALMIAGLIWVFTSRSSEESVEDSTPSFTGTVTREAPLKLHRSVLKRDYGNARLDIDIRVFNSSAESLVMNPPKVKLLTAKNTEVASFFLPFEKLPEVPANSTQDVQLRYWLESEELNGSLTLEIDGQKLEVKDSTPLQLDSLPNGTDQIYSSTRW